MLACDIECRAAVHRGLLPGDGDVLLEHEPALVARRGRGGGRPRRSARLRPPAAGTGRSAWPATSESSPAADPFRQRGVDVLEMDVADAIGVIADELRRVDAADQQVAAVEAPRRRRCAASARATSCVGLHERADVRVQDEREAVAATTIRELAQVRTPARCQPARRRARRAATTRVLARRRRRRRRRRRPRASCARCAPRARAPSAVASCTTTRHEAADEAQPVAVEQRAHGGAVERQPAERRRARSPAGRATAISDSTRSGGSCRPQPGTSQTPHEMGAPAKPACSTATGGALLSQLSPDRALRLERSKDASNYDWSALTQVFR